MFVKRIYSCQITPCTVQLNRYSIEEEETDSDRMSDDENDANQETEALEVGGLAEAPVTPPEPMDVETPLTENPDLQTNTEPIVRVETVAQAEPIFSAPVPAALVSPANSNDSMSPLVPSPELPRRKGRVPKKHTDMVLTVVPSAPKKPKLTAQKGALPKKSPKPKSPPQVCFLCGKQFKTGMLLDQHQKTHLSTRAESPVFPCNICGQKVKNLKIHMRGHKDAGLEAKNGGMNVVKGKKPGKVGKKSNAPNKKVVELNSVHVESEPSKLVTSNDKEVTKEEASSSTDAVFTTVPPVDVRESISTNEAQTNSSDSIASSNGQPPNTELLSTRTVPESVSIIGPPIVVDEYPPKVRKAAIIEPISVNEPSQSNAEHSESEENGIEQKDDDEDDDDDGDDDDTLAKQSTEQQPAPKMFKCNKCTRCFDTQERVNKHQMKHDLKVNCTFCGKLYAMSYVKLHIKAKHQEATM